MKRRVMAAALTMALLLTGCGAASSDTEEIRRQYGAIATAQMEAEVTFHTDGEERCFTLQCDYTPERSEVTVTAPETVAGICATLTGEELLLHYEGESLSVGEVGLLNPVAALPQMLQAVGTGYLLEESQEKVEEIPCRRLLLDLSEDGEGPRCAVWIDEETYLPRYAELSIGGETKVSIRMLAFSCTLQEENTEE